MFAAHYRAIGSNQYKAGLASHRRGIIFCRSSRAIAGSLTPAIIAARANNEARMKDAFLSSELNIIYLPKNSHPLLN